MIVSLDLETCCNIPECGGYNSSRKCSHALSFNHGRVTDIGIGWRDGGEGFIFHHFPSVQKFKEWLLYNTKSKQFEYVGQNFKFDLHFLKRGGVDISDKWAGDTRILYTLLKNKIPKKWIEDYNVRRKEINIELKKELGVRHEIHRAVRSNSTSLKVLAPYYLDVPPFWEKSEHSDVEYLKKDVQYTYDLWFALKRRFEKEGGDINYHHRQINWGRVIFEAEHYGIKIDLDKMDERDIYYKKIMAECERNLKELWGEYAVEYKKDICNKIAGDQLEKCLLRLKSLRETSLKDVQSKKSFKAKRNAAIRWQNKKERTLLRYKEVADGYKDKVAAWFNLNSDLQMLYLLRDKLGLDCKIKEWDKNKNQSVIKESTGEEVLQRHIDRKDIALFHKYRESAKLSTSFFPAYRELQYRGRLHTTYHMDRARTGRLTSSNPNLQQCPSELHSLFIADRGRVLMTKDVGAIEPALLAFYSEDEALCKLCIDGRSFHTVNLIEIAKIVSNPIFNKVRETKEEDIKKYCKDLRDAIKECGLSILYGAGKYRVKSSFKKRGMELSIKECNEIVVAFREIYIGVWEYKERLDNAIKSNGGFTNLFGRPFYIDKDNVYMKGLNTLIQGGASELNIECAYRGMMKMREKVDSSAYVALLVHDETVFSLKEDTARECEKIYTQVFNDVQLQTKWGKIPLTLEGDISKEWSK